MTKRGFGFLVVAVVALVADALTKYWIQQELAFRESLPMLGQYLRLTLTYNSGIAFGLLDSSGVWLLLLTGSIILAIGIWSLRILFREQVSPITLWSLALIVGGASANFVDRLADRRVTDLIDVGVGTVRWPTFNLADSWIVLGMGLLFLILWRHPNALQQEAHHRHRSNETSA